MKTDSYTKAVLTVIALCLLLLTVQNLQLFPTARANPEHTANSFNSHYLPVPLNADGSISVKLIPAEDINVRIKGISTSDELNINLEKIGGSYIYGSIPVELKE